MHSLRWICLVLMALAGCSQRAPERIYIEGLEECNIGGQGGDAGAPAIAGMSGDSDGGGDSSGCGIDDPIAIAQAHGLTAKLYYIADDPGISNPSGVSLWPNRVTTLGVNAPLVQNTAAWRPTLLLADPTLGSRASVTGDGVDDRLIENAWNGPGRPSIQNWGFVQLAVKYVTWRRAKQGWGSQALPTRGVHTGETRSYRHDNGGSPIILTRHTQDGVWARTIHQFTGNGIDWGCSGSQCLSKTNTRGDADSASRALFGCNNPGWDPIPPGGNQPPPAIQHDQGNCFSHEARGAILHWAGNLPMSEYNIFDEWVACWYGGSVATD